MNKPLNAKRGFTLIELLTVIAILAILGAIIFPTVGQFRTLAKKSSDSSDLRNIVQASQLFAAQNGERLVGPSQTLGLGGVTSTDGGAANTIVDVAAVLAYGGELTDPKTWVSANETTRNEGSGGLFTATVDEETSEITGAAPGNYDEGDFSFSYVTGLQTSDPATTPVAFTRMTSTTSNTWGSNDPYGNDGGHVAFLGGNVSWYNDLGTETSGELIATNGTSANSIDQAVPDSDNVRQPSVTQQ
ncbi:type II secretion system protein [Pelagicoccus sp. SDUM812005]|uniref:type II secretion system protein n=1 Tax=Pelagicoccus sp. SDUM812005 TaxID=3041257 RepID=UPI0028101E26|nr:type II secretion system protein [Pelagicoccus sp. SDUM812005]MDQ8179473.1 type II secretion system protein [Pelagicoccus sp. SDUM812005]